MKVFITSPWVPREWIAAHGLEPSFPGAAAGHSRAPAGLWAQPALRQVTPAAGVCGYAETVLWHAEREESCAFIFTTHCDQLRRSYDELTFRASGRIFLFNLPATCGTLGACGLFQDELRRLSEWLVRIGGRLPDEDVRRLVMDYQSARRKLIEAASWCPARRYAEAVLRFHSDGCVELPSRSETFRANPRSALVRLALVGGPFTPQFWPLLDEIETAGGKVVLNATEAGERSLGMCEPGDAEELVSNAKFEHLSSYFLNRIVDVFQRPNDRLFAWLKERVLERNVQAIVLWHYFGCDLWRAEWQTLQEMLGLPVLLLEADETGGGQARRSTRIQAFLETLVPA